MVGSIVSAAICSSIGIKATFILGGINLTMVAVCLMVPALKAQYQGEADVPRAIEIITGDKVCIAIIYIGSILSGFGEAIIWVA